MKIVRKAFVMAAVILIIGISSVSVFAATSSTPAEIASKITGRTLENITAEKNQTGTSYGAIAQVSGKLEEFQAGMLELRLTRLNERVAAGIMTQEQADAIIASMKENQAVCITTGAQNRESNVDCVQDGTCTFGRKMSNNAGNGSNRTGNLNCTMAD